MESIEFLAQAFYFLLKVCGIIFGGMFLAFVGVLVVDELKGRSNELYEYSLSLAVWCEYLIKGRPQPKTKEYHGRHRLNDPFIHDLVVELRANPNSLCYNRALSFEKDTEGELCGVF